MSKEKKCVYTTMLSKLTDLDEQIHKMQASLAKVREMVNAKFIVDEDRETSPSETKGDT